MDARDRLIFALDVTTLDEVKRWLELLKGYVRCIKVGKELFVSNGPDVVRLIRDEGYEVFLDLKFHDIPSTVAGASKGVARLGVKMFTIHALGGLEMMESVRVAVEEESKRRGLSRPLILAVTVLTSLREEELREVGIERDIRGEVLHLSRLSKRAGLDGVITSPLEVEMIKREIGEDFIVVTPGIRPASSLLKDQKRTATPSEAIRKGSDYIVIGRPIMDAPDPVSVVKRIISEMEGVVD